MREKVGGVWQLKQRTTTTGGDDDETVFDSLARPVRMYGYGPAPKANTPRVMQVIEYDRLSGNVAKRSVPTAEGTPDAQLQWDAYQYDALSREILHRTPWNATTTTSYDGLLVDVTDPLLHHTITELDALQRPVVVTDAANGKTLHKYGPFDALRSVTDPGGAVTKWTRDAFGRVTQLDEPDRGTTTFVHSGFGDLLSSTDALGREVTWTRDALGRTKTRTDKQGAQLSTTTWTWDTAANGIGQLHWVKSTDAVKTYSYTKRGQPEGMTLSVGSESFTAKMAYDDVGRATSLEYPWPLGEQPFGLTYDYDAHGHRTGVRDTYTNEAYWQLTDVDQAGRYKEELFGNATKTVRGYHDDKQTLKSVTTTKGASTIQQLSYDWDDQLNLKSRTDALQPQNKTERFRHDALDRLTCAYFSPNENPVAPCMSSYAYAANGNLTSKSDVGILSYTDAKHPHAVTNAPGETYAYDAVGNQVTRPGGVVMTYTPFDLPKTITQGATVTTFGYDGDAQRIRKTTSTTEAVYFDDLFEQVKTGNAKAYRYYVHAPERVVAIVTRGGNEPGTKYVHVDHLGSTETLTNESGAPIEKRSYDPFGQRRNENWALPPPASFTSKTTKGFTGHEEDDEFGLVNMRGRVFDPRLGRFLSTDPIIRSVFDGQALNAFAYVRNNPLALVDPSGFTEEEAWRLWRVEETGQLGIHITFDKLTPPAARPAPADVGAQAPTNDVDTTGSDGDDYVMLPIIETPHPSGPGTDDPFGVYPTDIELGYLEPITTFDQLVHGDSSGGRRTFIIEGDSGLGHDLRHAFGPKPETIILRPRIGGVASDDESLAKQNLAFEAGITIITMLTPGPLDDIAAAGLGGATKLRGVPKVPRVKLHANSLETPKPAVGYSLRHRPTGTILKYGESTQYEKRYPKKYLDSIQAELTIEANGTKREMHEWQHKKILEYKSRHGKQPPLNKSDW